MNSRLRVSSAPCRSGLLRPDTANELKALDRPGQHSLRKGRVSIAGQCYHVTWSTNNRIRYFAEYETARVACVALSRVCNEREIEVLSWVLMPDHFHAVLRLGDRASLGETVARMKAAMAGAVNLACHAERGRSVWQSGFYDRAIRRDEDLLSVNEYVVANPIRAGLAGGLREYSWWNAYWLDQ
jgi:putative transposase